MVQSDSNLKGLHFDEEEGLWYLDHRVVVPAGEVRERILQESHDAPYRGHVGKTKSLQLVTRNYWWPHLRQDVTNYVLHCPLCQRNKGRTMKQAGLLQPLPVPTFRWESVSLDFIMQLPMTRSGHDAIVVFVDRLTKMVHFAPTHTECSAEDVAKLFAHNVFRHHGLPAELVLPARSYGPRGRFQAFGVPLATASLDYVTAWPVYNLTDCLAA